MERHENLNYYRLIITLREYSKSNIYKTYNRSLALQACNTFKIRCRKIRHELVSN